MKVDLDRARRVGVVMGGGHVVPPLSKAEASRNAGWMLIEMCDEVARLREALEVASEAGEMRSAAERALEGR